MKKIITICFVMLVSTVNAGYFFMTVDIKAMTVSVEGQADADIYLIFGGIGAPLTNFVRGPAAPSLSGYTDSISNCPFLGINPPLLGEVWVIASGPGEQYKAGTYLTASWTWDVKWVDLYTYNEKNELFYINWLIPEPSAISLFLAGLVLFKKKIYAYNRIK